jgi:hypothetical protein
MKFLLEDPRGSLGYGEPRARPRGLGIPFQACAVDNTLVRVYVPFSRLMITHLYVITCTHVEKKMTPSMRAFPYTRMTARGGRGFEWMRCSFRGMFSVRRFALLGIWAGCRLLVCGNGNNMTVSIWEAIATSQQLTGVRFVCSELLPPILMQSVM